MPYRFSLPKKDTASRGGPPGLASQRPPKRFDGVQSRHPLCRLGVPERCGWSNVRPPTSFLRVMFFLLRLWACRNFVSKCTWHFFLQNPNRPELALSQRDSDSPVRSWGSGLSGRKGKRALRAVPRSGQAQLLLSGQIADVETRRPTTLGQKTCLEKPGPRLLGRETKMSPTLMTGPVRCKVLQQMICNISDTFRLQG